MNPLLFIPSVRQIPEVIDSWNKLNFDKLVVRMKLERAAYKTGRDFFLHMKRYTHIIICPDDLVIDYDSFMMLKRNVSKYNLSNLAGISNLDEGNMDTYCCKPLGVSLTAKSKGSYYEKKNIPKEIFEVGFTGFTCQWLERSLVEKLSFTGGCNDGAGCMDSKFTEEMIDMGEIQLVQPNALFYHMRMAEYHQVRAWKNRGHEKNEGYNIFLNKDEKYTI